MYCRCRDNVEVDTRDRCRYGRCFSVTDMQILKRWHSIFLLFSSKYCSFLLITSITLSRCGLNKDDESSTYIIAARCLSKMYWDNILCFFIPVVKFNRISFLREVLLLEDVSKQDDIPARSSGIVTVTACEWRKINMIRKQDQAGKNFKYVSSNNAAKKYVEMIVT